MHRPGSCSSYRLERRPSPLLQVACFVLPDGSLSLVTSDEQQVSSVGADLLEYLGVFGAWPRLFMDGGLEDGWSRPYSHPDQVIQLSAYPVPVWC